MKLSRQMRQNLNLTPDAEDGGVADYYTGEKGTIHYASQLEPLAARGLLTFEQVTVMRPVWRYHVKLTPLGRRVKMQNTDD